MRILGELYIKVWRIINPLFGCVCLGCCLLLVCYRCLLLSCRVWLFFVFGWFLVFVLALCCLFFLNLGTVEICTLSYHAARIKDVAGIKVKQFIDSGVVHDGLFIGFVRF